MIDLNKKKKKEESSKIWLNTKWEFEDNSKVNNSVKQIIKVWEQENDIRPFSNLIG